MDVFYQNLLSKTARYFPSRNFLNVKKISPSKPCGDRIYVAINVVLQVEALSHDKLLLRFPMEIRHALRPIDYTRSQQSSSSTILYLPSNQIRKKLHLLQPVGAFRNHRLAASKPSRILC